MIVYTILIITAVLVIAGIIAGSFDTLFYDESENIDENK